MKRSSALILLFFLIAACTVSAYPQTAVATGTPPFSSLGGGPFDVVNLGNLNVHFVIPVFQRSGRGQSFSYNFTYDSSIWTPVTSNGVTTWTPVGGWGWQSQTNALTGYLPAPKVTYKQIDCGTPPHHIYEQYEIDTYPGFVDPLGTFHSVSNLTVTYAALDCGSESGSTRTAADGSGYTVTVSPYASAAVVLRNGTKMALGVGVVTDANGNQITTSGGTTFYDTLSSTTPALTISGNAPSPVSYKYTSPQNTSVGYTMNYLPYTVKTNFGVAGITGEYGPTKISLVSSVQLPDLSSYTFTYEQTPGSCTPISGTQPTCVTGRILEVTLPSGGTITYGYTGGPNGTGIESDGSTAGLTRQLSPGGLWKYDRAQGTAPLWTTTVTDPNSNQTVLTFSKDAATSYPTPNFYETQRQVYQGSSTSGTLFLTVLTCYNNVYTGCANGAASVSSPVFQTDVFRSVPNGSATKTSASEAQYNNYGLTSESKQYDFGVTPGSAPPSSLLLTDVVSTYGSWNGTTCVPLSNNIVDSPCQITTKDGNGSTKAQTTFTYDQGSVSGTSGTPQHVSVTGSRGNLTTVASLTSGSSTLNRTFTYYDTGTVNTATDVNGGVTTAKYGTGSCGNSLPTEIDRPLGLIEYSTWDSNCAGAVLVSSKDVNGNITNYAFNDPNFWRATGSTNPDGGATTVTYNLGTNSPWNIVTSSKKDSSINVTSEVIVDGFGRTTRTEMTSDPGGTDYVDTVYDSLGRVLSVSNPYRTTSDQTYGITQYAYDPLNRVTSVTHPDNTQATSTYIGAATQVQDEGNNSGGTTHISRVSQVDGLGRLTSVCEVSSAALQGSAGTPAACGQDIAVTGFLTSYQHDTLGNITSVSQPGVNTRTFSYDDISRLTQEVNPESGTTTYTYDHTGQLGDLYQRTRPKQNQTGSATVITTYTFDALHRATGTSYNDGTTPSISLSYDQTSVGGVSPAYPKGHLTYAVGAGGTASTIFSYDTMGRVAQEWQCTPLNCGASTFSLQYSHDYLGDVTQLINGREGVTYTYSYNAAAQLTSLQSSLNDSNHPGTLLTVNTYNPLGEVQKATLGNGIVRNLGYDNRGRLTSLTDGSVYNFTLGYAPDSNILTGNDLLNGNWTYTSDAMARLATSSKSGQAFSYNYDPSGNRWKQNVTTGTGPNPQYTFDANNHITGYSYDAAGNLLNDTFHSYTYDAEGRLLTVDGTVAGYVYDAFGQRVRSTVNSTAYDFIYNGGHAVDEVAGSNWVWGHAGGTPGITYTNSTTYFDHADWVGTVRARSNVSGTRVETCTSLAFGDSQSCTGTDDSPQHFGGLSWDSESNLQHALLRQLSTTQGRWTVPDPSGLAAVSPGNPQTWNRYAYVLNNPLRYIDPSGQECVWDDGSYDSNDDPESGSAIGCGRLGGTWVDHIYFLVNGMPDWSGDPNAVIFAYGANNGIKDQMLNIVQGNSQCASLYGGQQSATNLLNKMTIIQVPSLYTGPFQAAYNAVTANNNGVTPGWQDAASTVTPSNTPNGPWNGSQYGTFVGTKFNAASLGQQETILFHEMAHPYRAPDSNFVDLPWGPYTPYAYGATGSIPSTCGTEPLPPVPPSS